LQACELEEEEDDMLSFIRSFRTQLISIIIAALVLALTVIPAMADSNTYSNDVLPQITKTPAAADTTGQHYKGVSVHFQNSNPCYGPAMVEVTYDGVFHTTKNKNGTHVQYSVHGDYSVDPLTSSGTEYTGRFNESRSYQLDSNGLFLSKRFVTTVVSQGMVFHITFIQRINPVGGSLTVENFACAK
jgi:hypothetical protein